jgi:hypothetical protein
MLGVDSTMSKKKLRELIPRRFTLLLPSSSSDTKATGSSPD